MNAILGAGLLGQSYAASQSGYIIFPLVLLLMAVAAWYAAFLLLEVRLMPKRS